MSLSSIGSSSPYPQWPLQSSDGSDPSAASPPSDPLQALYQAVSGGNSSDPLLAAIGDGSGTTPPPPLSPQMMQALLTAQGSQANSSNSLLQSVFSQFDADGNGQISQSEFENAIGSDADRAKVDALFAKIDSNDDGSISSDEMQLAMQKAHGGGHHHHGGGAQAAGGGKGGGDPLQALLSGASADGTTSQTASNADGSTTTTITYTDGTKVEMTTPAAPADAGGTQSSAPRSPNLANLLKQLISLQAQFASQFAAPTTSLTV